MSASQLKFQQLLRELFQFDVADLDFGIYRIMNQKRQVIEGFINEDLPKIIADELAQGALAEQAQFARELEDTKRRVLDALGVEALDADGHLAPKYFDTPAGKAYLAAQEKAKASKGHEALEIDIYNHLYTFFSRYWQDGDFISRRRYSKKERYAIPYNGEEVTLYWANHDQYYIKTGEYFTDYTWQAPNGVSVHFKLKAADVEQNNVKGEKRFFLPHPDGMEWDEAASQLTIPFEFRPFTEKEKITYAGKNPQEAVIARAVTEIPKKMGMHPHALAALATERRKTSDDVIVTYLEHHLRQYTRHNTSDFFIHKDLKGFLSRELDFYLKNEVLNLEEMESAGESLGEGWFQLLRLVKKVGGRIIEFLAQIEEFQKMLWEKRKFVTETFYCITLGQINERFHAEIAGCEAQWEEWKELGMLNEAGGRMNQAERLAFLKEHPTLPIDTRRFDSSFVDRLLASFDNLDKITDGLLVHSENWQALNLLLEMYHEQVQQIHIDPPYNTDTSGFVYKNDYRHSSWLSMMTERISQAREFLQSTGLFTCHIDENEFERLRILLENNFGYVGTAIWDKLNPMMGAQELAIQHEYIFFCTSEPRPFLVRPQNVKMILSSARDIIIKHGAVTEQAKKEFTEWVRNTEGLTGGEKAYQYLNDDGRVYQSAAMAWPNPKPPPPEFYEPLIHPGTGKPCPVPSTGWSRSPAKMKKLLEEGEVIFGSSETVQPRRKIYLSENKALSSIIRNGSRGKTEIEGLGLDFTYNHPSTLYTTLLDSGLGKVGFALDYFAGSGTTGHAVINLNREDGGRRKFILVEMADYFDSVLLPRLKKVTFSPEWKDGKPKRMATAEEAERSPRIVKVIRLESYEDALNNLAFDETSGQQVLIFDDYLLQYMLKWETRLSETLLNVEKLDRPFSYQLHLHREGETKAQPVDLPETFNYLIGLGVKSRQVLTSPPAPLPPGEGRKSEGLYLVYRGVTREGRKTTIIWRETAGWTEEEYHHDRDFVGAQELTKDADEIFVNGDSLIPGARALEPLFKARMFAGVEA